MEGSAKANFVSGSSKLDSAEGNQNCHVSILSNNIDATMNLAVSIIPTNGKNNQ